MNKMIKMLALGTVFAAATTSQAAMLVFSDTDSFPGGYPPAVNTTNWGPENLSLSQYNGAFDFIKVIVTGSVLGNVKLESQDAAPSVINYALQASLITNGPSVVNLQVIPAAAGVFNATAFDGNPDFDGTSGASFLNLSNTLSNSILLTTAGQIAPYIGGGFVNFTLNANGLSFASGAGNLLTSFNTSAGGEVTVEYYLNEIPSPAAMPFGLAGFGLLALRRVRRQD